MMTHRICLAFTLAAAALVQIRPAAAEPTVIDATAHTHRGVYVQFTPGIGAVATGTKLANDTDVSLAGPGSSIGVNVGYAVAENWLLGLELSGAVVFGPTLKQGGMEVKSDESVKWSTYYAGVAASHYFMPLNLRVGLGVGALQMALDLPNLPQETSKTGVAARLVVAKEWWVSPRWGLGVALESTLGAVPDDKDNDKGWGVAGFDLALSATYD
jgi:opacity protein-like surface antigen